MQLQKPNVTILKCRVSFTSGHVPEVSSPVQELQPSCRAMRFVDDTTRFLRASVKVQKSRTGTRSHSSCEDVKMIVEQGLTVDGQKFSFLGYTDSQLKNGSMMFFREGEGWTVKRLLEACGDLESVYANSGYGKYCARLGLSFSSTAEGLDVPLDRAALIDDVTAIDGSLVTDGVGMIADSFARQLCEHLGIPEDTVVFQVRRGGIKGLLVTSGALPLIAYRPSMKKYDGGPTVIEVANISSAILPRAHLNHQFISLLLTLGISVEVFLSLLDCHLERIKSIATDRERAIDFLSGSVAELDSQKSGLSQELLEMLLAGQDMDGPVAARIRTFQDLQYKSLSDKLHIDVKESCWLFGVVDEQGILSEGEVYVNLTKRVGILSRKIVVGRSPAYAPGDIRILRGVDRPELSHIKNCIVFPKNCQRSIPDMMGGGDLDGDKYWVSWDDRLIPDHTNAPEERNNASKPKLKNPVTKMKEDATNTFVDLCGTGILGIMSKAWVKAVEANPTELANDSYARSLVPLIETAMDMTKTGADAKNLWKNFYDLPKMRKTDEKLAGNHRGPFEILRERIPNEPKPEKEWTIDLVLATPEYDEPRWKSHYDEGLVVMREFNRELAISIKKDQEESQGNGKVDKKKQSEADMVKAKFLDRYFKGLPKDRYDERLRASAWYALGFSKQKEAFAWLGMRYLNQIKAEYKQGGGPVISVGPRSKNTSNQDMGVNPPLINAPAMPLVRRTLASSNSINLEPSSEIDNVKQRCVWGETVVFDGPIVPPSPEAALGSKMPIRRVNTKEENRRRPDVATADSSESPGALQMEVDPVQLNERSIDDTTPPISVASKLTATVSVGAYEVAMAKPTYPVATPGIPPCHGSKHIWTVRAGGTWRHYTCLTCQSLVKEKKLAGIWCPNTIINGSPVTCQPQDQVPRSATKPPVQFPPEVATEKPTRPVATSVADIPACTSIDHIWGRPGFTKAGGSWRNYTCANCKCVVKEKRRDGIWCPDVVLP